MTFFEILSLDFFELHFYFLTRCVNKTNACHLVIDCCNKFVSVPLHLAMKWRMISVLKVM